MEMLIINDYDEDTISDTNTINLIAQTIIEEYNLNKIYVSVELDDYFIRELVEKNIKNNNLVGCGLGATIKKVLLYENKEVHIGLAFES